MEGFHSDFELLVKLCSA